MYLSQFNRLKSYTRDSYFYTKNSTPIWTPETGYKTHKPSVPPWRVSEAGSYAAVRIMMNVKPTDFSPTSFNYNGFKVRI